MSRGASRHLGAVAAAVLVMVGAAVAAVAVRGLGDEGPSVEELRQRLLVVERDVSLDAHPSDAALIEAESILCADSSSPVHVRRFRSDAPWPSIVDFYRGRLERRGWRIEGTAMSGALRFSRWYDHRWPADGVLAPAGDGYDLMVFVDDGYESGCRR